MIARKRLLEMLNGDNVYIGVMMTNKFMRLVLVFIFVAGQNGNGSWRGIAMASQKGWSCRR